MPLSDNIFPKIDIKFFPISIHLANFYCLESLSLTLLVTPPTQKNCRCNNSGLLLCKKYPFTVMLLEANLFMYVNSRREEKVTSEVKEISNHFLNGFSDSGFCFLKYSL